MISPTFTVNVAAFFGPRTVVRIGNAPVIWIRDRFTSDDGGKTFREDLSDKLHPDMHALAIQNGSAPLPFSKVTLAAKAGST